MSLQDYKSKEKEILVSLISTDISDTKWISTIIESYIYSFLEAKFVFDGEIFTENCILRDGKCHGEFTLYDNNGNLRNKGMFEYGKKVGEWFWWHSNGKLLSQVTYIDDKIPDGDNIKFDQNGNINFIARFVNGKFNGPCKEYYPNGTLKSWGELIDNKKHGIYKEYFENGQLAFKSEYSNDCIIQKIKYWPSEIDTIPVKHEQFNYINSENIDCFTWNNQGNMTHRYHKNKGNLHGELEIWNDDGILIQHVIFDNNILIQTII